MDLALSRLVMVLVLSCASMLAVSGSASSAGDASADRRVALVLGNARYEHAAELDNPVNDAVAMAEKLRSLGFEVVEGVDRNVEETYALIEEFGRKAQGAYMAAFFYAGHGIQVNGENYVLPIDAKLEGSTSLRREAIALNDIMTEMEDRAKVKILILDACRDNPLSRSFRRASEGTRSVVSGGLAPIEAAGTGEGTFIVFATQPGAVAGDGAGRHSPFSQALLQHIDTPDMSITDMFTRVSGDVDVATAQKQRPWMNFTARGVVKLVPHARNEESEAPKPIEVAGLPAQEEASVARKTVEQSAAVATEPSTRDRELQTMLYDRAVQQNTIGGYEAYLNMFPHGIFAGLALSAIEALKNPNPIAGRTLATAQPQQFASLPQPIHPMQPLPPAVGQSGVAPADAIIELDREDRRMVQRRLGWLGFDVGRPDGAFGPRTASAIAGWQQANNMPPTGMLTLGQFELMITQTAEAQAQWQAAEDARAAAAPPTAQQYRAAPQWQ